MTTLDEFIDFDYELENDEVCYLFKYWVQENKEETTSNGMINENDIIKILSHFYPDVQIVDKKYIMNISCSLWDKVNDITNMLSEFKKKYDAEEDVSLIDFDKIYEFYCRLGKSNWKASKRFFEKYVCYSLSSYIEYDHFLSSSWLNS